MSLHERITEDMKAAMRARESARLSAVRLLLAALKQRQVDERATGKEAAALLPDADVLSVIEKMIKQRRESIAQFEKAARNDLAETEKFEIGVLSAYLPQQLGAAEAINSGITTVQHIQGWMPGVLSDVEKRATETIRAYEDVGMRVSYCYAVRDQNRLVYQADGTVTAAVKLQELFGLAETPRIGPRQEPVLFYFYTPHWLHAQYDLTMVELPEWTEDSFPGILLNVAAGTYTLMASRSQSEYSFGGRGYSQLMPERGSAFNVSMSGGFVAGVPGVAPVSPPGLNEASGDGPAAWGRAIHHDAKGRPDVFVKALGGEEHAYPKSSTITQDAAAAEPITVLSTSDKETVYRVPGPSQLSHPGPKGAPVLVATTESLTIAAPASAAGERFATLNPDNAVRYTRRTCPPFWRAMVWMAADAAGTSRRNTTMYRPGISALARAIRSAVGVTGKTVGRGATGSRSHPK